MTKQSEVEMLAKDLHETWYGKSIDWSGESEEHRTCYREFAQNLIDKGYVKRSDLVLDEDKAAGIIMLQLDACYPTDKRTAFNASVAIGATKALAAAKDEIIKIEEAAR